MEFNKTGTELLFTALPEMLSLTNNNITWTVLLFTFLSLSTFTNLVSKFYY